MENKYEKALKAIADIMGVQLSETKPEEVKEQVKVQLANYNLKDGTVISCEGELAEGVDVSVQTADGVVPATDGEYQLEDGRTVTIAGGKVSTIAEAKTEEEAPVENTDANLEGRISALETTIKELATQLSAQKEINTKLSAVVKTISEMSATETVQRTETIQQTNQIENQFQKLMPGKEGKTLNNIFKAISKK